MSAAIKLLNDLSEIEQEIFRLFLLITGELNEIEKTVSHLRSELLEVKDEG